MLAFNGEVDAGKAEQAPITIIPIIGLRYTEANIIINIADMPTTAVSKRGFNDFIHINFL